MQQEMNSNKEQELEQNKQKDNFFTRNKKPIIVKSILSILLVLIILSIARVPYVGQFFDSVFFSFIFGYAKYAIYLYLVFIIFINIFKIKWKPLYSKRYAVCAIFLGVLISMMLGGIQLVVNNHIYSLSYYCKEIWYKNFFQFNGEFNFSSGEYIDGGIIGAILASIPGIFIIILALILIVLMYFIAFKQQRNKLIKAMVKKFNKKQNIINDQLFIDEIKKEQNADIEQNNEIDFLAKTKQKLFNLNDSFSNTSVDFTIVKKKLNKLLALSDISTSDIKISESQNSYYINFNMQSNDIDKFNEEIRPMIKDVLNNNKYDLLISEADGVVIKMNKVENLINHSLKKYLDYKITKVDNYSLCLNDQMNPITLNFNSNNILCINSDNNENTLRYINALIAHLSINYLKKYLQISYISNDNSDWKTIISTQNSIKQKLDSNASIKKFITLLNEYIDEIEKNYKKHNVNTIYDLNKKLNACTYKHHFIIMNHADKILGADRELINAFSSITKVAHHYGIVIIMVDNSDELTLTKWINFDYHIAINMNQNMIKNLFKSNNAKLRNDFALVNVSKNEKYYIVLPRANNEEAKIIDNKLLSIYNNINE